MVALSQQKIGPGLGASEVAAAMGLHRYKAPIDLFLEKTGQAPAFEGNAATEWGHFVETRIREWYVETQGVAMHVPPDSLYHPELPWLRATPDGIILDGEGRWVRGFEAKNANWRVADRFGDPGTDEVPEEYLVQVQVGLAVTGLDEWHLAAAIGGAPPAIYVIHRDDDLIAAILEDAAEFWDRVQRGIPPEIDHTAAYKRYLERRGVTEVVAEADEEIEGLLSDIKALRESMQHNAEEHDLLENRLRERLGTATQCTSSIGKLTWRPSKPSAPPAQVAKQFREKLLELGVHPQELDALVEACKPEHGPRPLKYPKSIPAKPR